MSVQTTLSTVQSVTSVHALISRLAIRANSLVLILQNTQHLIEGWVQTETCVVSCWQFETYVLSVLVGGTKYTVIDVVQTCQIELISA